MSTLSFRVTALGPLAFPTRKPGTQFRESHPYVPGATIFGALGQRLQARGEFDLDLLRDLRCHNAYPATDRYHWARPLPSSALLPKAVDESAQIVDGLYGRVCWEQQEPAALVYAPVDSAGRPWGAAGRSFYTYAPSGSLHRQRVAQRTLTRVSINRRRSTAEDQRLYSFLALSEVTDGKPTQFLGSLECPDAHVGLVSTLLGEISHLGARQTTGLGAVQIAVEPAEPDSAAAIGGRIAAMSARFTRQAEQYALLGGKAWDPAITPASIFSVNLLADAILYEQGWLPTTVFSPAQLAERTGIAARLLRAFTTPITVGGWQVTWQRPKPTELGVQMGGLYLFQANRDLGADDWKRLLELQRDGIGERRSEGFGQVRICDDFHVEGEDNHERA